MSLRAQLVAPPSKATLSFGRRARWGTAATPAGQILTRFVAGGVACGRHIDECETELSKIPETA